MPEILADGGLYFDPTSVSEIKTSILEILNNDKKRKRLAEKSFESAKNFKWKKTSNETFNFFAECMN